VLDHLRAVLLRVAREDRHQGGDADRRAEIAHQGVDGGTFGADLTHVYSRFQDAALSDFLRRPCFPRAFPNQDAAPLTDEEAFAVKAFLFKVDRSSPRGRMGGW